MINNIEPENYTTAARCKIIINNQEVDTIIDSGAATSVISHQLLEKLGLKIMGKSNVRFTIANNDKVASLGKTEIEVIIQDWILPIEVQVIENRKDLLLFGSGFLAEYHGKIDYKNKELILELNNETLKLPIKYHRNQEDAENDSENEENNYSDNDISEYENEYEENDEQEMYGLAQEYAENMNNEKQKKE